MTDTKEIWREHLILTSTGAPKTLLANAITALREAPAWQGVLAYDQFAMETIVDAAPPWDFKTLTWVSRAWSSHDDLLTAEWLQRNGVSVNTATAAQAVEAVARDRSFHPVHDYLSSLQHDGGRSQCDRHRPDLFGGGRRKAIQLRKFAASWDDPNNPAALAQRRADCKPACVLLRYWPRPDSERAAGKNPTYTDRRGFCRWNPQGRAVGN